MRQRVKVYELRRKIEQINGKPQWVERPEHLYDLEIEADSVDAGRAAAAAQVQAKTGRAPRSLSCLKGGGYTAIVPSQGG